MKNLGWFISPFLLSATGFLAAEALPDKVDYSRDIKRILSNNCYACHGPDAKKVKGGLRLDSFESATKELKSGERAVVPKDLSESAIVYRITTKDADEQMPPADSNKKLSDREIALLKKWVEQGAEYSKHWAYVVPKKKAPPKLMQQGFNKNDIDPFILNRLREKQLKPAKEADRRTLIRRLTFDLTGLPPTWQEVKAFAEDKSPNAYEKLVGRLLAKPQYGERMAVYWLDMVRYADTIGYHSDNHETKPLYRDYVIEAFNKNKPYDQFTREQLAGDLMKDRTTDQLIASGYNRLNMNTREGGSQPKEYTAKYLADRVRNTSTVWMATTLGCAECHDHKFDPFTSKDFYSFGAFFADLQETPVGGQKFTPVPSMSQQSEVKALKDRQQGIEKTLNTQTPELDAALAQWEKVQVSWTVLQPAKVEAINGTELKTQKDYSILASGKTPEKDTYTLTLKNVPEGARAFRIEVMPDKTLPKKGPGRAGNGNFVITEVILKADGNSIPLQNATASFEQTHAGDKNPYKKWNALSAIDGDAKGAEFGWAVLPQVGKNNRLLFEAKEALKGQKQITFVLKQDHGTKHTLGRFQISATTHEGKITAKSSVPPKNIGDILAIAPAKRNANQKDVLAAHYRSIAPELAQARKVLGEVKGQVDRKQKSFPTTLVSTSMAKPRMVRILPRGNWLDDSGPEVKPAVPGYLKLGKPVEGRAARTDLAEWITSKNNPLTARVMVNRLWAIFHGRGLATPLDDFGAQGVPPTHPALLDWLAVEFMESGWDIKHMVRLMVTSGTYRQTSVSDTKTMSVDPYNQWLTRQGRWRLEAEMVRDNALSVSGLLVKTIGGASVKPYQPVGYWAHLNFPKRSWKADSGNSLYRRGLYTYWCRTFMHPSLAAFDAPSREECTVERIRSNTPQQALVLLNDPTFVEAARIFAERIIREGGKDAQTRLTFAYQQALNRNPTSKELSLLSSLLTKHRGQYKADQTAAETLLKVGAKPADIKIEKDELAAWTSIARVVLNLHETITRN